MRITFFWNFGRDEAKPDQLAVDELRFVHLFVGRSRPSRHGVRQLRTGWSDGPAYVTQCPIRTGQSFVYNFTITGQRGTLFWHAHVSWMRATLYGPIVILPKRGVPFPFPVKPYKDIPIIFGACPKPTRSVFVCVSVCVSPHDCSERKHAMSSVQGSGLTRIPRQLSHRP